MKKQYLFTTIVFACFGLQTQAQHTTTDTIHATVTESVMDTLTALKDTENSLAKDTEFLRHALYDDSREAHELSRAQVIENKKMIQLNFFCGEMEQISDSARRKELSADSLVNDAKTRYFKIQAVVDSQIKKILDLGKQHLTLSSSLQKKNELLEQVMDRISAILSGKIRNNPADNWKQKIICVGSDNRTPEQFIVSR